MLPARHDLDAFARRSRLGRDVAADRPGPDDGDVRRLTDVLASRGEQLNLSQARLRRTRASASLDKLPLDRL
jgi:hypothetical protein